MTEAEQVEYWKQQLRGELERSIAFNERGVELCNFGIRCINMVVFSILILATTYLEYFMISKGYW